MFTQTGMLATKADIITRLRRDILPLQGFKTATQDTVLDELFGTMKTAFPNAGFPMGAVHEFLAASAEDMAATSGFISGILSALLKKGGAAVWIGNAKTIFPPALACFGIAAEKIIFIHLKKEKEMLWAMEEALKCEGLAAVIGEIPELDFTASRRLQLAVEESRVTGFILRRNARMVNTTACVTRWKITPLASRLPGGMPGLGFPCWNAELLKVRNGKPGSWAIEWNRGKFRPLAEQAPVLVPLQKKAI